MHNISLSEFNKITCNGHKQESTRYSPITSQCPLVHLLKYLSELSFTPLLGLYAHLDRSERPILSVIMAFVLSSANTRAVERLVVRQRSEDTEDDGYARIHLQPHERV